MDDPIRQLIDMAPSPAVLFAKPAVGEPSGGTEDNNGINTEPATQSFPLIGAFSNAVDAELDGSAQAIFTIHVDDYPELVRADYSRARVAGGDYIIDKIRTRFWLGQINGYTFALKI